MLSVFNSIGFIDPLIPVKLYCATDTVSSATVPDVQYTTRDSTSFRATCYVDHGIQDVNEAGWTTVPSKHKNTLKNSHINKREG